MNVLKTEHLRKSPCKAPLWYRFAADNFVTAASDTPPSTIHEIAIANCVGTCESSAVKGHFSGSSVGSFCEYRRWL